MSNWQKPLFRATSWLVKICLIRPPVRAYPVSNWWPALARRPAFIYSQHPHLACKHWLMNLCPSVDSYNVLRNLWPVDWSNFAFTQNTDIITKTIFLPVEESSIEIVPLKPNYALYSCWDSLKKVQYSRIKNFLKWIWDKKKTDQI